MNTNPNGHECNELVDGDYLLADDAAWFTVKDFSVRIQSTDEGVVVDIYKLYCEDDDPIASAYASDDEIDWQCDKGICEYNDRTTGKCDCYNEEEETDEQY